MNLDTDEYKVLFENSLRHLKNHVEHILNVYVQSGKTTINSKLATLHTITNRTQEFYNLYRKE